MSEPVRVQAIRILDSVLRGGGNSSLLLERVDLADPRDRALLLELVLGSLRRLRALDFLIERVASRPLAEIEPRLLAGLRIGAFQLQFLDRVPDHAAVGATVGAIKIVAGPRPVAFANGILRAVARGTGLSRLPGPGEPDYLTVTLSVPELLAARWAERFGIDATVRMAEVIATTPPLVLRVLRRRSTVEAARARLEEEGFECEPGRYAPLALRTRGGAARSAVVREGWVQVQDEAAQLVAGLISPQAGERVLDACAAPGGKAIAIGDDPAGAAVIAMEGRLGRIRRLARNLATTVSDRVIPVVGDAARPPFAPVFDWVLVDAPCTATGTVRRNPEVRYRLSLEQLERSRERNLALVRGAAGALRPGGRLVYATCSLEPEENEEVVAALLESNRDLVVVDPRPGLAPGAHHLVDDGLVLRTQPGDLELDGFTVHLLERRQG